MYKNVFQPFLILFITHLKMCKRGVIQGVCDTHTFGMCVTHTFIYYFSTQHLIIRYVYKTYIVKCDMSRKYQGLSLEKELIEEAKKYAEEEGFSTVTNFIRFLIKTYPYTRRLRELFESGKMEVS